MSAKKTVYISAKTGRYVPKTYAKANPSSTVGMRVKKG
jgi:hypothetical protein